MATFICELCAKPGLDHPNGVCSFCGNELWSWGTVRCFVCHLAHVAPYDALYVDGSGHTWNVCKHRQCLSAPNSPLRWDAIFPERARGGADVREYRA